ncbi:PH domain-containing protein [Leucobacter allii]|uniref:PH domain-containing protein n=1 Tax=Leucobacter allii TaxID=2932247 RepID=A0ABY4FHW2_9MICO|nr:PH domain-containing protein [Leucobacter allii]UOQ56273.1 PH domain-containing protein [Leucobacter allii]
MNEEAKNAPAPSSESAVPPNDVPAWQRVSSAYAWADLAINLLLVLAVVAALVIVLVATSGDAPLPPRIILPIVAAALLVNALFAFRRVRAIGYILREDDLLFRRGIMFERIVAVPYGRLQLVDITRGPLLRALGLATLKFVTASAATGVQLPGLRNEDAEALRDRLVALAETRRSGL